MKPSLSMILPVRNREAALPILLAQVLEVLPELTPRWELVVVDDGSTDATPEVLQEQVRLYPQVTVIHNAVARGDAACLHAAVPRTRGELLLLRAEDCDRDLTAVGRMWRAVGTHDLVVARAEGATAPRRATPHLMRRRDQQGTGRPTLQLIRRRSIEGWITGRAPQDLHVYLTVKGYPLHEVELPASKLDKLGLGLGRRIGESMSPHHCDQGEAAGRPKRPNYLLRLKAFALGE